MNFTEKPMNGVFKYANWGDSMETIDKVEIEELDCNDITALTKGVEGFTIATKFRE